jgi:small conductance mechanosensitive channel
VPFAATLPAPTALPDAVHLLRLTSCVDDRTTGTFCDWVYDTTGSRGLAESSVWLLAKPVSILVIVVLTGFIRFVLHRLIRRVAARAAEGTVPGVLAKGHGAKLLASPLLSERRKQRAETMSSVLRSITTGVLLAVATLMILDVVGLPIGPLLASAGIVGVAVGFGAQSLVKDFLSGICMIFEDQYGVGDVVDVGEATGTIEAVTLRITRLRDLNGTVWYVPNGEILRVGNMSQNWSRAVVDVSVGYGEDLSRVKRVLSEVAHDLWEDDDFSDFIIEEPEITGVEMLAADSVNLRVLIKTRPMEQWAVAREMRQRIKTRFDHEGIEIPFAQRVVWHRDAQPPRKDAADASGE